MVVNIETALPLKVPIAVTQTRKISEMIRPYSMAVAPDWLARKAVR